MTTTQATPLLQVVDVTVTQQGTAVLQHVDFSLLPGQHWAIVGQPEASKNKLLQLLAGKISVSRGAIHHHHAHEYLQTAADDGTYRSHHDLVAYVPFHHHFRNRSNVQHFYYQQRFNSLDADDAATVQELLGAINPKNPTIRWTAETAIKLFGLQPLADKTLIKLSNGETRRLMLAAALVRNPSILLLDHPLVGLDMETRQRFDDILDAIVHSGIHVIMTTTAQEIPHCITHVAVVNEHGIAVQGPTKDIPRHHFLPVPHHAPADPALAPRIRELVQSHPPRPPVNPVVAMENVTVSYGGKRVLDGINWRVEAGEAWALQGHNGAGKSTLLSLINGDNPQAYSNAVTLFGRRRGTGESIWDIKQQIGYVSPEFHQYFPKQQTVLQVVLSGFFDTVGLFRAASAAQRGTAVQWLDVFGLSHVAQQRLAQLGPDQQRLCLLARAVIKNPTLLILDEPCQGLSPAHRDFFKALVDELHRTAGTTLIYVSHYDTDIPSCVTRHLLLAAGKVRHSID